VPGASWWAGGAWWAGERTREQAGDRAAGRPEHGPARTPDPPPARRFPFGPPARPPTRSRAHPLCIHLWKSNEPKKHYNNLWIRIVCISVMRQRLLGSARATQRARTASSCQPLAALMRAVWPRRLRSATSSAPRACSWRTAHPSPRPASRTSAVRPPRRRPRCPRLRR
jgi:hypothetical protein